MDWEKLGSTFGLPGLMLVGIYMIARFGIAAWERISMERVKVEDKRADATVAALTSLSGKIDNHHTDDLQSHQDMAEGIANLHGKIDGVLGNTPVHGVPRVEQGQGYYPPGRPKTQGGR